MARWCEKCGKRMLEDENYVELLIASRTPGEPPPLYAAKFLLCLACEDKLLD